MLLEHPHPVRSAKGTSGTCYFEYKSESLYGFRLSNWYYCLGESLYSIRNEVEMSGISPDSIIINRGVVENMWGQ